jgi:hypothetical protein
MYTSRSLDDTAHELVAVLSVLTTIVTPDTADTID